MLASHRLQEHPAPPSRMAQLLQDFRTLLREQGMASMDEYGDMLKWALPSRDGMCRYFHVFDPGFCSFSDAFRATIHYHGGQIRGTVLLGRMEHFTYEAQKDPDGDRFLHGDAYRLTKHTRDQPAGTSYILPAMVPHWLRPSELTLTYFEEEDNGVMGDLLEPATGETDDHVWEQADAEALVPELLARIDARLAGGSGAVGVMPVPSA